MGRYSSFANLLKDQATHDRLPEVLFTDNADLRSSTSRLAIASVSDNEVSVENIIDVVNEFDEFDSNRYEYGTMFSSFEAISNTFAAKLKEGVDTLHGVKDTVSELKDKYEEMVGLRIAEDPTLAKICGISKELHMNNISWNFLDEVDERSVVTELHDKIGHDPDHEITPGFIGLVINAMPCANKTTVVDLKRVKIEANAFNSIIEKLMNFIPGETKETVAGLFTNLCNLDQGGCELAARSARNFIDGKTANKINDIMHIAVAYNKLFDAMNAVDIDLSASTMEELGKHVDAMHAISSTMLYIAMYYRNNLYKDAVLVPGPFVNTDNFDEFESNGGTVTTIVHHYNKFYDTINVPIRGVSGTFILKSAERLEAEASSESIKNVAIINNEKKRIERGSFIRTSVEYLKTQKLSSKFFNGADLDKYAAAVYDSMPNVPVESRFYKLLINAIHPNTITSMLYDRISKEYVDYAAKTGKLSKETCEELDEKVYADMISEYLVNQGILVV